MYINYENRIPRTCFTFVLNQIPVCRTTFRRLGKPQWREIESAYVISNHLQNVLFQTKEKNFISCTITKEEIKRKGNNQCLETRAVESKHCPGTGRGRVFDTQGTMVPCANGKWVCQGEDVLCLWGRKIPAHSCWHSKECLPVCGAP